MSNGALLLIEQLDRVGSLLELIQVDTLVNRGRLANYLTWGKVNRMILGVIDRFIQISMEWRLETTCMRSLARRWDSVLSHGCPPVFEVLLLAVQVGVLLIRLWLIYAAIVKLRPQNLVTLEVAYRWWVKKRTFTVLLIGLLLVIHFVLLVEVEARARYLITALSTHLGHWALCLISVVSISLQEGTSSLLLLDTAVDAGKIFWIHPVWDVGRLKYNTVTTLRLIIISNVLLKLQRLLELSFQLLCGIWKFLIQSFYLTILAILDQRELVLHRFKLALHLLLFLLPGLKTLNLILQVVHMNLHFML